MFRFSKNSRFRVIVDRACWYSTAAQIRAGVGDLATCNAAVQKALDTLEFTRGDQSSAVGISGVWSGLQVQLNLVDKARA